MKPNKHSISCPNCKRVFSVSTFSKILYCPLCGRSIDQKPALEHTSSKDLLSDRYQFLENIGKGGMGEVFLAFDTLCGRRLAIKKIRSDLLDHPHIRNRFLKEAHITCQLTHPSIIPIYSIQAAQLSAYYTMPFVEGETLKQIIRKTLQQERGEKLDHIGSSIPALMRIFMSICQAVAYAHSKDVLHRDLKPENIIIGKYGEVLILDWGLAKYIYGPSTEEETPNQPTIPHPKNAEITRIGKVVGTVSYMAPERAMGQQATIQTDIYALGVILYQILTLRNPFKRSSLEEFRKNISQEKWVDPVVIAPYRDIPRMLARIAKKCVDPMPQERYQTVDELIFDLENYLEGRSDWFLVGQLDIKNKSDWEFQEHVLIAEHMAITRTTEQSEWVNLMISHQSFTGNTQIITSVCMGENGQGIGILFSVPEASERTYINDGYCLWLGTDHNRTTKLLRSNVEVMHAPDIFLRPLQWTNIRIEKIDKSIHLYLNEVLQFSYIVHLPVIGTHIGILSRDADFEITPILVSVGSLHLTVNCLAVPDAFLAHRDFAQALSEYRRIAYSFPDRAEGREALFRAGLTFIEQAKGAADKSHLLEEALKEFEKLHGTPGGPLEYLGKALVYQTLNEDEEEIKCFELAFRRYPKHPLLSLLQDQVLSRMHEVSRQQRATTYRFILLTMRHFRSAAIDTHTRRLFSSLQKHWESLPFIEEIPAKNYTNQMRRLAIPIAFWLGKPYILGEIIDDFLKLEHPPLHEINNALISLIELGSVDYAKTKLNQIKAVGNIKSNAWIGIQQMIACHDQPMEIAFKQLFYPQRAVVNFSTMRVLLYALDRALDRHQPALVYEALQRLENCEISSDLRLRLTCRHIWALLLEKKWQEAEEVFYKFPIELLNKESTPLHFLYGCWLAGMQNKEMAMIHFMSVLQVSHPRSWNLAGHALIGDLLQQGWLSKAFLWEKRELYRQLSLYYHCLEDNTQSQLFFELYTQQFIHDAPQ